MRSDAVVKILGSSAHSKEEREKHDFYATDPHSVKLFLETIKQDNIELSQNIWECACGDGAITNVLTQYGHTVFSTDIVKRNDTCDALLDMTKSECLLKFFGDVFTNPPYKHVDVFVRKSLDMIFDGSLVIMFLRLQFLEGKKRRKLFDEFPPKYIYVHSARQKTYKNNDVETYGNKASAVCFAWFVWEKGYNKEPILRWI